MIRSKNQVRIYRTFILLTTGGLIWLSLNLYFPHQVPGVCIFKHATGIPCPSCGMTNSVMELMHFNFEAAFMANPLGYLALLIMFLVPPLLVIDLFFRKGYFYTCYNRVEMLLKRNPALAGLLAVAIVGNWLFLVLRN